MFKELIKYRELLWAFTVKNIKIRYKQTAMGFLWAIFMPVLIVISGIMVKKAMAVLSGVPLSASQIISVSVKALPWAFFIGALKFATTSLVSNMNLVTKIYFPREIFPLSYVISHLFDFFVASLTLAAILFLYKVGASVYLLWLPVMVLFLILLTAGFSLLFACGTLFFRDVKYIVDVILTFGIFFTPVFYDASMFGKWETFLLLNPIGSILENINTIVVLHKAPDTLWLIYTGIWSVGGFLVALLIFQNAESAFAENI